MNSTRAATATVVGSAWHDLAWSGVVVQVNERVLGNDDDDDVPLFPNHQSVHQLSEGTSRLRCTAFER